MGRREYLIKRLQKFIFRLSTEFKVQITIFFGSKATGKAGKESDIDLIIVSRDFKKMNFIERAARMYDFWDMDYPVDFLCYTPEEFKKLKGKVSIVREALKEGIKI